jgi:hypothetical protein
VRILVFVDPALRGDLEDMIHDLRSRDVAAVRIDLSNNYFDDECLLCLVEAMRQFEVHAGAKLTIAHLDLSHNRLTNACFPRLVDLDEACINYFSADDLHDFLYSRIRRTDRFHQEKGE